MDKLSKRRLVENEVIFRDVNKDVQEFVDEHLGKKSSSVLPFYCECSNPDCIERISLSTNRYALIHKNKKQFIAKIGHEFPEVEKVVKKFQKYQIVEKYFAPPKASDISRALKNISGRF